MNQTDYFYATAITLWQSRDYKNAVSRMYYAVLHCMCDELEALLKRRVKPSHKVVRNLFICQHPDYNEEFFAEFQKLREKVDYERRIELQTFNEDDLLFSFNNMRDFVEQRNPYYKYPHQN